MYFNQCPFFGNTTSYDKNKIKSHSILEMFSMFRKSCPCSMIFWNRFSGLNVFVTIITIKWKKLIFQTFQTLRVLFRQFKCWSNLMCLLTLFSASVFYNIFIFFQWQNRIFVLHEMKFNSSGALIECWAFRQHKINFLSFLLIYLYDFFKNWFPGKSWTVMTSTHQILFFYLWFV